jgi:hypothetical protein
VRPSASTSWTKSIAHRWSGAVAIGRTCRATALFLRFGLFRFSASPSSE